MASAGEDPPPCSTSSVGLEALFPPGEAREQEEQEEEAADGGPELARLRERLRGLLAPYEPLILRLQRLLVWERPLCSVCTALTLNTLFWFLSSTSLRPLFLLSVCLLGLLLLDRWKHKLFHAPSAAEVVTVPRESMGVEPRLLSVPELSHHLAESYLTCCLYVQETLQYKRQHHGKFCVGLSSGCLALALLGHYVPGIMISYIIVLSVLLWPLVVYHELIQKMYTGLEPILMKLDYSMKGDTERRKHDKKRVRKEEEEGGEPRAETESESEEELSCFAPTVDVKTTALAMAITDSELSDEEASILESGGFSVSRATTPQLTDVSEDLDQQSLHSDPDEAYLRDLPDFPSVEDFPSVGGEPSDGEALGPAGLLLQHLASPLHFVNTHFNGTGGQSAGGGRPAPAPAPPARHLEEAAAPAEEVQEEEVQEEEVQEEEVEEVYGGQRALEALSEEIVSTAISTVVQNTLTALLRSGAPRQEPGLVHFLPTDTLPGAMDPTDDDDDDDDLIGDAPADEGIHATTATTMTDRREPGQDAEGAGPRVTLTEPEEEQEEEEEEDFELLDQSELEQMDEGRDTGADRQLVGGASGGPDTPPPPQHQPES